MSAPIIADYRELARELKSERDAQRSIALANGCFDLLHVGHVRLLAAARREADVLVVALNSDESARALKGPNRPAVPLIERMELVAALADVDYVTSFGEPTADAIIRALQPNVLIKGTDRTPDEVPERETLREIGARVAICGDPKTHSSSELVDKRP
ncbi:MAG: adenylyltransferase/cytidyltransferase family protein [bacterium]|nr:adenylyltransferase/cytidyltransferase family protein [bacterium]